ncbi:hypothetical protein BD560DRAFT_488747 [Blakeslea trispora]|nr:hypothetical protein BD560DRAFT_488747 [Blakeslea trispora]
MSTSNNTISNVFKNRSLYSIIKVEANLASKYKECPRLEVLCEYRRYLRMKKWGPPKRFPQTLKNEIEDLISDLSDNDFDDVLEFQEKIGDMKKKTNCKAAKRLLQFTCCLVDNLVESPKKVGEMELQTSIVHTLMLQLFKLNKGYNPYSSNLVFDKHDACLKGVRPDYLVVVNGDYKNVVGKVKPEGSSKSSLEWDLLRLGVSGRQMLETEGLEAIVCFQVIGNNIDFYIMSSQNDIFFLTHVESVTIPLFYRNFSSLPSQMNSLYNIMSLYENLCQKNTTPSTSSAPAVHSPFPSFDMIKNLYNDNKKTKSMPLTNNLFMPSFHVMKS